VTPSEWFFSVFNGLKVAAKIVFLFCDLKTGRAQSTAHLIALRK